MLVLGWLKGAVILRMPAWHYGDVHDGAPHCASPLSFLSWFEDPAHHGGGAFLSGPPVVRETAFEDAPAAGGEPPVATPVATPQAPGEHAPGTTMPPTGIHSIHVTIVVLLGAVGAGAAFGQWLTRI